MAAVEAEPASCSSSESIARASAIYCSGELLHAVQRARVFDDCKHFVDMPLRADPEVVLAAFASLSQEEQADPDVLRAFLDEHFTEPGTDLVPHRPADFPDEPPLLAAVADHQLREFLVALHELWPTLVRVVAPEVFEAPHRFSALPRRAPVVLPGGRFRETYYWDSYWIVEGLIASGMLETATGLVQNLVDDVMHFGFVPNGGRIYYLNRSQPPLLCDMVTSVARALPPAEAESWLPRAVLALQREHAWWTSEGSQNEHIVTVEDFRLNRYCADWFLPRPESYREDFATSEGDGNICREIATAAETGWDFSVRWIRPQPEVGAHSLDKLETSRVVPIDLNAILYRYEAQLAMLLEASATSMPLADVEVAAAAGGSSFTSEAALRFEGLAAERRAAIESLMWCESSGYWNDLWLPRDDSDPVCPPTLASFAAPLWAGLFKPEDGAKIVQSLQESGLLGAGGAATTLKRSGEQWDCPNAWPPLQSMLIEGLRRLPEPSGGPALAADLAQRWVGTCYLAWRETGYMHEKYDATVFGSSGKGGEYEPQVGFGWSNGVVLQLLRDYGQSLTAPGGLPGVAPDDTKDVLCGDPCLDDAVTRTP